MGADTNGHRCALTVTNAGGVVALCSCEWIGSAHYPPSYMTDSTVDAVWDPGAAERAAVAEHVEHTNEQRRRDAVTVNDVTRLAGLGRRRFGHS